MQVLAVLIAAIVALIAFQQWWLSREKLRLELFGKRYAVYEAAREFVGKILTEGKAGWGDQAVFYHTTAEAEFLFGSEISEYLKLLSDNASDHDLAERTIEQGTGDLVSASNTRGQLAQWFHEQAQGGMAHVFARYLRFQDLEDPITRAGRWLSRRIFGSAK